MPADLALLVFVSHFLFVGILTIFGLHRLELLLRYYRYRKETPRPKAYHPSPPIVTVQLPLYNEKEVAERLIRCVAQLRYPQECLEIQVLDDSTDETAILVQRTIEQLAETGLDIVQIRRKHRYGFKAGALEHGLESAKGELIAIFDADFLPPEDFLERTVDFFTDSKISMVQARWSHLNTEHSLLTRAQSILLDGHFQIEHTARSRSGFFFNFNGTAGIWRRTAIDSAGGWKGDTLTEDLDLSYRAQLGGARFVYLLEPAAPAELPIALDAFKSQQHRWTKGAIEVLKKLAGRILSAPLPWRVKAEAFLHLTANFCYPILLLVGLLILPTIEAQATLVALPEHFSLLYKSVFLCAFFSIFMFYTVATRESRRVSWLQAFVEAPLGLIVGIALSLSNSLAVIEAVIGSKGEFNRTPKTGDSITSSASPSPHKRNFWRHWLTLLELLLSCYFAISLLRAAALDRYETLPFLSLFFLAFYYFTCLGFSQFLRRAPFRFTEKRDCHSLSTMR